MPENTPQLDSTKSMLRKANSEMLEESRKAQAGPGWSGTWHGSIEAQNKMQAAAERAMQLLRQDQQNRDKQTYENTHPPYVPSHADGTVASPAPQPSYWERLKSLLMGSGALKQAASQGGPPPPTSTPGMGGYDSVRKAAEEAGKRMEAEKKVPAHAMGNVSGPPMGSYGSPPPQTVPSTVPPMGQPPTGMPPMGQTPNGMPPPAPPQMGQYGQPPQPPPMGQPKPQPPMYGRYPQ